MHLPGIVDSGDCFARVPLTFGDSLVSNGSEASISARSRSVLSLLSIIAASVFHDRHRTRQVRGDRIVPFSVERITINVDRTHLRVGDPDGLGITVLVKVALHMKPAGCRRGSNELDDDLVADERLATPVLCDAGSV